MSADARSAPIGPGIAVRPRRRRAEIPGISLTPLLDVIFNLIFFFILATTIPDDTFELTVQLPRASAVVPVEETPTIVLQLDEGGRVYFEGRPMGDAELKLRLHYLAGKGEREVWIHGDERAQWGRIYALMGICLEAGLTNIQFQGLPEKTESGP